MINDELHIVIDSREQQPWAWATGVRTSVHGLDAGDYALRSDCTRRGVSGQGNYGVAFAIERKSLDDFLGTISTGWDRFIREIQRMEHFPARVVIVEGDFETCCFRDAADGAGVLYPDHEHIKLLPQFVAKRIGQLTLMGVSVVFAGDAALAAGLAYQIFKARAGHAIGSDGK